MRIQFTPSPLRLALLGLGVLPGLEACQPPGDEGFVVELFGRVVNEYGEGAPEVNLTFGTLESALIAVTTSDDAGWYTLPVFFEAPGNHLIQIVASGPEYVSTKAWVDVNVEEGKSQLLRANPPQTWSGWTYQLSPLPLAFYGAVGSVEGILVDAVSGLPVGEMNLDLLSGWNAPETATVAATLRTGRGSTDLGRFSSDAVPPGVYTARVSAASGYATSRFPVLVRSSGSDFVRAVLSPDNLENRQMRVSAAWGDAPSNVNLHLSGPRSSIEGGGTVYERYHVWEGYPSHPASPPQGQSAVAAFDRLDADGGGPETLTVRALRSEGRYRVSLFDASNAGVSGSSALAGSDAVVQVWVGEEASAFFVPTPGTEGNRWIALEWDAGESVFYPSQVLDTLDAENVDADF